VGNGQPLVLQGTTTTLTTAGNPFNSAQTGDILIHRRRQCDQRLHYVGRPRRAAGGAHPGDPTCAKPAGPDCHRLQQAVNSQQNAGLDLGGQFGATLFSVGGPSATASSKNTDNASVAVSIANVGALTANDYVLSYKAGAYSLTRSSDGQYGALSAPERGESADGRWSIIVVGDAPACTTARNRSQSARRHSRC